MKKYLHLPLLLLASCLMLSRCNKKDSFSSAPLSDYMNPAVGKYITYRLDSLKFINFGQKDTVIKYQAKDIIEGTVTDNLNRNGWRVVRYLNDTAASGPWNIDVVYFIFPTRETVEVVENNLRFLKLSLPVKNDFNWAGNTYIDVSQNPDPSKDLSYLSGWRYTYANVSLPFAGLPKQIDSTITVNEADQMLGTPGNVDAYSERVYSQEVYGRKIGLVYKKFIHWIFQARDTQHPNGYYDGYGLTLKMIDHN